MLMTCRAIAAASLMLVAAPSLAQTTIPDANPDLQSRLPLRNITNSANGGESGSRAQVVYDAGFFGAGTQSITGFSLRAANGINPSAFAGNQANFENVIVRLSTTSRSDAVGNRLSTTFADNIGSDQTTVFSGALSLTTAANGTFRPFDYTITFANAFTYNPMLGNLLLDVLVPVGTEVTSNNSFGFIAFAADGGIGDGAASVFSSMNAGQNGNSTVGTFGDFAPTVQFATSAIAAVPEPASWAMMILGFGMVGGAMRSRARRVRFAIA